MNFDQRAMLPDMTVKPLKTGYDCTHMIILPIFIGTNTVAQAMANAGHDEAKTVTVPDYNRNATQVSATQFIKTPITKVHSIDEQYWGMPFWSYRCLKVQGE